jgi:hypothetical protein
MIAQLTNILPSGITGNFPLVGAKQAMPTQEPRIVQKGIVRRNTDQQERWEKAQGIHEKRQQGSSSPVDTPDARAQYGPLLNFK